MSDKQLTPKEKDWLLSLLANLQISGKPAEVRETLKLVEGIEEKLRASAGQADS